MRKLKSRPRSKHRPQGKLDRTTKRSMRRLWGLLYRAVRRNASVNQQLVAEVAELRQLVVDYRKHVEVLIQRTQAIDNNAHGAINMARSALAAHHDTHCSVTGEHIRRTTDDDQDYSPNSGHLPGARTPDQPAVDQPTTFHPQAGLVRLDLPRGGPTPERRNREHG